MKVAETESKATNTIIKFLFGIIRKGKRNCNNEKLKISLHMFSYRTLFWFIVLKEAVN